MLTHSGAPIDAGLLTREFCISVRSQGITRDVLVKHFLTEAQAHFRHIL